MGLSRQTYCIRTLGKVSVQFSVSEVWDLLHQVSPCGKIPYIVLSPNAERTIISWNLVVSNNGMRGNVTCEWKAFGSDRRDYQDYLTLSSPVKIKFSPELWNSQTQTASNSVRPLSLQLTEFLNPKSTDIKHDGVQYVATGTIYRPVWNFTWRMLVVSYRHFGTTCRSQFQGSNKRSRILLGLHVPFRWNLWVFPKRRYNTNLRCVESQKGADFIYKAAEGEGKPEKFRYEEILRKSMVHAYQNKVFIFPWSYSGYFLLYSFWGECIRYGPSGHLMSKKRSYFKDCFH